MCILLKFIYLISKYEIVKNLLLSFAFIITFTTFGQAQFNFGAGAQLIFDGSVFGVQGKALYEWDETWRGAGTFTVHLKEGLDWTIDLDGQYKLLKVSDNFDLAPLAGLGILKGSSTTDIGLNLGAFIDFVPSDSYHIYIEPKIVLGGADAFTISGGILF